MPSVLAPPCRIGVGLNIVQVIVGMQCSALLVQCQGGDDLVPLQARTQRALKRPLGM